MTKSPKPSKKSKDKKSSSTETSFPTPQLDKSLFSFYRCHQSSQHSEQLEGKYRLKIGSWAERYLILYCDYVLYYELKGNPLPRDDECPIGALPIESIDPSKVNFCEEKVTVGGLIPKSSSYENCIELVVETERTYDILIQFDSEETTKQWLTTLRSRAKSIRIIKPKFDIITVRALIDHLISKYPIMSLSKNPPAKGQEEAWIQTVLSYWRVRNKHRKDLRRSLLFSDIYSSNSRNYIDWFVTPGGVAGAESLERELVAAEDQVVNKWKVLFKENLTDYEAKISCIDPNDPAACYQALLEVAHKMKCAELYIQYYTEVYPSFDLTEVRTASSQWSYFIRLLEGYLENIEASRKEKLEGSMKQMQIEKQTDELFGNAADGDDLFADIDIVRI